ncbi:MAG: MBL fold metallo-hydrolase [Planctomycetes bacterium]|nr:MBL fold metallo-hydrolase [Planctomycetota bacterium]
MTTWKLVITGCGTSHGNPPWGYKEYWSDDPRDHRRRSGAMIFGPQQQCFLIDTSPDLMHCLRNPYKAEPSYHYPQDAIEHCDAVFMTHDHADHCHGLNDLRHINRLMNAEIPVYGNQQHLDEIQRMFPYCFADVDALYSKGSPALRNIPLADNICVEVHGMPVTVVEMNHGPAGRVSGYRFGNLAYLTDLKVLPELADQYLHNLDILVINMLREEDHPTHQNWQQAQAVIERLQPQKTVLTHMGYEVHYADWQEKLPPSVCMAYDGMTVDFTAVT